MLFDLRALRAEPIGIFDRPAERRDVADLVARHHAEPALLLELRLLLGLAEPLAAAHDRARRRRIRLRPVAVTVMASVSPSACLNRSALITLAQSSFASPATGGLIFSAAPPGLLLCLLFFLRLFLRLFGSLVCAFAAGRPKIRKIAMVVRIALKANTNVRGSLYDRSTMRYHHTKSKGDLGLVHAMADLAEKGWGILAPLTEHAAFDLVAFRDDTFLRVQVKYRAAVAASVSVLSSHVLGGSTRRPSRSRSIGRRSICSASIARTQTCYYVDPSTVATTGYPSADSPTRNNMAKRVTWAKDFTEIPSTVSRDSRGSRAREIPAASGEHLRIGHWYGTVLSRECQLRP